MSPLFGLWAMGICLALAYLTRNKAQHWGRMGEEPKAIVCYLRAAAYVGASMAFALTAFWASITN